MEIQKILSQYSVPFQEHGEHHHSTAGWISTDCPHCSPNTSRFRLGFELSTSRCNCWVCGLQNRADVLTKLCGISYTDAHNLIGELPYAKKLEHKGELKLPKSIDVMKSQHKTYLENRGFDPIEIKRLWGVKGIGIAPDLQWRLFIPISDEYGKIVSWTTRSLRDNAPLKYISARSDQELVPHKTILYGEHLARQTIVIVEGPIDVWAIGPGAVATFGLSFSPTQLHRMLKYKNRIICFDSERDAQKTANRLLKALRDYPGTTENVMLQTGSDPADADKEEIQELRKAFLQEF